MAENESKNFIEEIVERDLADGKVDHVVTRFPPEPNGYLHLGHAKAICLNFGLAEEFGGKCNLRFDDTNPVKEDAEYIKAIKRDIEWLGFEWAAEVYGSDYFDFMYECAERLIEKGLAYVDDLTPEQMREYRGTLTEPGRESPYRGRTPGENMDLFRRMKAGEFEDGTKVLRAKIDMASPNLNLRDPAIYRIVKAPHHRTGEKWVIYPMYDFAHPLEDAYEGVTHSVCTMEFEDHRPLYDWFVENCECKNVPHQYEFARLNLTHTVMSKRYLKKLVDDGVVSGWDDPRMPTLSGVRRRGYTPAAIRDFCDRIGVAKAVSEVDVRLLEYCVREDLNANAPRVMGVLRPLKLTIENYPEGKTEMLTAEDMPGGETVHEVPFSRHLYIEQDDFLEVKPNNKYFRLYVGGEVRLKNAYIIKCERVVKDGDGNITEVICTYDKTTKSGGENSGRKVKGTLHWVERDTAVRAQVRLFDYLFTELEDGTCAANPGSLTVLHDAVIEPHIKNAGKGDRFQFMRQGYFCIDTEDTTENRLVFNQIVSLKDSFAKTMNK
ncbi:glutamine--tRNA ligase/YqeY domain fusion protein [Christensenella intestinihominis]|uniref:glutamine--tRNA ligase/YqeY domain fusion protein n=1 Tax=Christensenella intestinihominis TaxID=1851429 RepID=UPI00082FCC96|nr:glutamine--tRNA ligase/YqeY domain fusion protein [Christensenella intestinihominis]